MAALLVETPTSPDAQWFASWFDTTEYRRLYAHRDEAEAARLVDALVPRLQLPRGARVLDLGCGAGRHSRRLAAWGLDVTGLDLAATSIREASRTERPGLRFRRHDMRVPFGTGEFDGVFNFFTSFGYFDDAADHLAVVRNISRALKPGGTLVLDYLNAPYAEARLKRDETVSAGDVTYRIRRWTDGRHFFKRIAASDARHGTSFEVVERVARFSREDFERMFARHGLVLEEVCGDYDLGPYATLSSPRMILMARRAGEAEVALPRAC